MAEIFIREILVSDAEPITQINIDAWKIAYRGIFPDHVLDNRTLESSTSKTLERIKAWQSGTKLHPYVVAENDGKVVGYAYGSEGISNDYNCQIQALYVAPQFHGKKIGTLLVRSVAHQYQTLGKKGLVIFTARGNPFSKFYEKIGGIELAFEKYIVIEEISYPLIGYGWPNILKLIE